MFAPPPEIVASVSLRLPDELRRTGKRSRWLDRKGHGDTHSFIEGPAFDRSGRLYLVDTAFGRIFQVSTEGEFSVFAEYDGEPNGIAIHRNGEIYVADNARGILSFDPHTGRVREVAPHAPDGRPFKGPNDLTFSSRGDLYFTDQGETGLQDPTGAVYRIKPDGTLVTLLDNIPSPNGLVLNASEDVLYLAVTRANAIWRIPMRADGQVYKVGLFIQLSGGLGSGPDGLAFDAEDNLAVAHAGLGSVWLFNRLGEPVLRIRSSRDIMTTNVAFGGSGNRTLFITESRSGTVLSVDLPLPGRPLFSHL